MINLRYHIVSLVAVFLALAIGVIAGTTVVDQSVVNALEGQSNALRSARDAARAETAAANERLDIWERFGDLIAPQRLDGALTDRQVVLVFVGTVEDELADRIEDTLILADASIGGRVTLTSRWLLPSEQDAAALSDATGRVDPPGAATALGRRFARSQAVEAELLARLAAERFLTLDGIDDRPFPASGALAVVISHVTPESGPDADRVGIPLLRALSDALPTVLVEPIGTEISLIDRVRRAEGPLRRRLGTVDHGDTEPGAFSLVGGLQALLAGDPAPHYGIRSGATAVAPTA